MDSLLKRLITSTRHGLWIGPLLAAAVWAFPFDRLDGLIPILHLPDAMKPIFALPVSQHRLLGLIVWAFVWWITEPVPLAYTALMIPVLGNLLGITSTKAAFAPFAEPAIFLFLGGFFIAKAMEMHGLDRRVTFYVLSRRRIGGHAWASVVAICFTAAFVSMWVSNTATMAMFLPITVALGHSLYPGDREAQGTILVAVAYAVTLGGIATPVGTPPNIVAIGFIESKLNHDLSFFSWLKAGIPLFLLLMVALLAIVRRNLPKIAPITDASQFMRGFLELGPIKRGERTVILAFATALTLWLLPAFFQSIFSPNHVTALWMKNHLPEANASILAAILLFVIPTEDGSPTLKWKEAIQVDWGTLLLFGGGLSLGAMILDTGLAKTFGELFAGLLANNITFFIFIGVIVFFTIFLGELTSNTACANMMIPIAIGLAQATGFNPVRTAVAIGMAASIGFMTPISTPPNAIAFSTGLIPLKKMLRMGFMLNIVGGLILIAVFWILRTLDVQL